MPVAPANWPMAKMPVINPQALVRLATPTRSLVRVATNTTVPGVNAPTIRAENPTLTKDVEYPSKPIHIAFIAKKRFGVTYMTNVYGLEIWSGLKKRDVIGLVKSDKLIGDCEFILNYIESNFEYNRDVYSYCL